MMIYRSHITRSGSGSFVISVHALSTLAVSSTFLFGTILSSNENGTIFATATVTSYEENESSEEGIILQTNKTFRPLSFEASLLEKPCELDETTAAAPSQFSIVFPTQYGEFVAECV